MTVVAAILIGVVAIAFFGAVAYAFSKAGKSAEKRAENVSPVPRRPAPIVTEIVRAGKFYPAEDYHQDFYAKNPLRYKFYRLNCGRDNRLEELWGDKG